MNGLLRLKAALWSDCALVAVLRKYRVPSPLSVACLFVSGVFVVAAVVIGVRPLWPLLAYVAYGVWCFLSWKWELLEQRRHMMAELD